MKKISFNNLKEEVSIVNISTYEELLNFALVTEVEGAHFPDMTGTSVYGDMLLKPLTRQYGYKICCEYSTYIEFKYNDSTTTVIDFVEKTDQEETCKRIIIIYSKNIYNKACALYTFRNLMNSIPTYNDVITFNHMNEVVGYINKSNNEKRVCANGD